MLGGYGYSDKSLDSDGNLNINMDEQHLDDYGNPISPRTLQADVAGREATCYYWMKKPETRCDVLKSWNPYRVDPRNRLVKKQVKREEQRVETREGVVVTPEIRYRTWHLLQPTITFKPCYHQFLDFPMNPNMAFKVKIVKRGRVRIGLAPKPEDLTPWRRHPATTLNLPGIAPSGSVGYFADSGELRAGDFHRPYGPALKEGEWLTCGIGSKGNVVFGLEGAFLGSTLDVPFRSCGSIYDAEGNDQYSKHEIACYCNPDSDTMECVTVIGDGESPMTYDLQPFPYKYAGSKHDICDLFKRSYWDQEPLRNIPASHLHKIPLYPTISVHSWGTVVEVNFDASLSDLSEMAETTKEAQLCKFRVFDGEEVAELLNLPEFKTVEDDDEQKEEDAKDRARRSAATQDEYGGGTVEDTPVQAITEEERIATEEEAKAKNALLEVWASGPGALNLYIGYEGLEENAYVLVTPRCKFGSAPFLYKFSIRGLPFKMPTRKARLGLGPGGQTLVKMADITWFKEVEFADAPVTFVFHGAFNAEFFWTSALRIHGPAPMFEVNWRDMEFTSGSFLTPRSFLISLAEILTKYHDMPLVSGYLCLISKDLDAIAKVTKAIVRYGVAGRLPSTEFLERELWEPSTESWMQAEASSIVDELTMQALTELQAWMIGIFLERAAYQSGTSVSLQCVRCSLQPTFLISLLEKCYARVAPVSRSILWAVLGDVWQLLAQSNSEKDALKILVQSTEIKDALSQVAWNAMKEPLPKHLAFDDPEVLNLLGAFSKLPKTFEDQKRFVQTKLRAWVQEERPGGVVAAFQTLTKVDHVLSGNLFVSVRSSASPPFDLALMNGAELQEFFNYWSKRLAKEGHSAQYQDAVMKRGLHLLVALPPSVELASQIAGVTRPDMKEALAAMLFNHFRVLVPSVLVADKKLFKWDLASKESRYAYEGRMVQSELQDRVEKSAYYWIADDWWNLWNEYAIAGPAIYMKPVMSGRPNSADKCISSDIFWDIFFEHFGTNDGIVCSRRESPAEDELLNMDNEQLSALHGLGKTQLLELRKLCAIPEWEEHVPQELKQVLSASEKWMDERLTSRKVTGAEIQFLHEQSRSREALLTFARSHSTGCADLVEDALARWANLGAFLKIAHEVSRTYPRASLFVPPAQKAVERWQALLFSGTVSTWSAWEMDLPSRDDTRRLQGLLTGMTFKEFCFRSDAVKKYSETGLTWDAVAHILGEWDRVRRATYETAADIRSLFDVLNIDALWAEKDKSSLTQELRDQFGEDVTNTVLFTISLKRSRGFVDDIVNTLKTFESVYPELQLSQGALVDDLNQLRELSYDNPTPEIREKVALLEEQHLCKWNDTRCTYAKAMAKGLRKIQGAHKAMTSKNFSELQRVVNGLPGMVEEQQVFQTLHDMMLTLLPLGEPTAYFKEGTKSVLDWLAQPEDDEMSRLTANIEDLDRYLEVFETVAREWTTDEYDKNLKQAQATLTAMKVELRLTGFSIAQLQAIRPEAVEQHMYFRTESNISYCFPDWTRFDQLKLVECRMLLYGTDEQVQKPGDQEVMADFRKLVSNLERLAALQLRMMQQGFLDLQLNMSLYEKNVESEKATAIQSLVETTTALQVKLDSETKLIEGGTFLPTTMLARVLRELKSNDVTRQIPKNLEGLSTAFDLQRLQVPADGTIAEQIMKLDTEMRHAKIQQDESRSMTLDIAFPLDFPDSSCSMVLYYSTIPELFLITAIFAKTRRRLPRFYELLLYCPNSQVPREELYTFIARLQSPEEDELFLVGGWNHAPKEHQALLRDKLPRFRAVIFLSPDGSDVQPPSFECEVLKNMADRNHAQAFMDGVGSLEKQLKSKLQGVTSFKSKYPGAGKSHRIQSQHPDAARLSLFHTYTTAGLQEDLQMQYEANKGAIWLNLSQQCPQQAELDLYRLLVCGLLSEPNAFPLAWKKGVPLLIEIPTKSDFAFLRTGIESVDIRPPSEDFGDDSLWNDPSVQNVCKCLYRLQHQRDQLRRGDIKFSTDRDTSADPKHTFETESGDKIAQIEAMGFQRTRAEAALLAYDGDVRRSIEALLDGRILPEASAAPAFTGQGRKVPPWQCADLLKEWGPKYSGKPAATTSAIVLIQFCRFLEAQFMKLHDTDISMPMYDREAQTYPNLVSETMWKLVRNAAQIYEVAVAGETFELSRTWGSSSLEPLLFLERRKEPNVTVFASPFQTDPSRFDWGKIGACVDAVNAPEVWRTLDRVLAIPKTEIVLEKHKSVNIYDVVGARALARKLNDDGEVQEDVEVNGELIEAGCTLQDHSVKRLKEVADLAITADVSGKLPMMLIINLNHCKKVIDNVDENFIVKNDFSVSGTQVRKGHVLRQEAYFPDSPTKYPKLLELVTDVDSDDFRELQLTFLQPEGALAQTGYVLTMDNVLKMILIRFRLDHGPVMIMGETGCGKTSLIKYLCGVSGISLHVLDVHGGIEVQHVREFMKPVLEEANTYLLTSLEPRQVWVFLDELNTSACVDFFAEMICDRYFDGKPLPSNLRVLGASNPYRKAVKGTGEGTSRTSLTRADSNLHRTFSSHSIERTRSMRGIEVKEDDLTLVYQVLPLPTKLSDFVWDFGALADDQRNKYIREMVKTHFPTPDKGLFAQLIVKSMKALLQTEDVSCVSLRDARRAVSLACFYHHDCGIESAHASVLAAAVCFYYRLGTDAERQEFEKTAAGFERDGKHLISPFGSTVELIGAYQDKFTSIVDIPKGVARNESLKANLFVMFTAVSVHPPLPVFVVGKPGQSKTLAVSLLGSGRSGQADLKVPLLSVLSYQCSEHTTAQGLDDHFELGEILQARRQNSRTSVRMVIFLDEVGLAEKNTRDRPLKVLHKRLEHPNVGFVGLSNTPLDASKMNRAIFLTHLDPGVNDLVLTSTAILQGQAESLDDSYVEKLANTISTLFLEYLERVQQLEQGRYRHLADFRGFYGLVKGMSRYISRNRVPESMLYISPDVCDLFVRNLGGAPVNRLEELLLEPMCGHELEEAVQRWRQETTYKESAKRMMGACLADLDAQHLMVIAPDELYALRFLLYGENPVLERSETKVFFGSSFQEEKQSTLYVLELLSKIRLAMEVGQKVVLVNLGRLHESLYEVLNQQYIYFNGKPTCRVALGAESRQVPVHKDFRCVVVLTSGEVHPPAKKLDEQESIQRRFLSALLSRFEKVVISYEVEIPKKLDSIRQDLKSWIQRFKPISQRGAFRYHAYVPGAADDLTDLLIVKALHAESKVPDPMDALLAVKSAVEDMVPPMTMLKAQTLKQKVPKYMKTSWRTSLLGVLALGSRLVVRTFDNDNIRHLDREADLQVLHLSQFTSRASFKSALDEEAQGRSLVIECTEADTPPSMLHDCYEIMQGIGGGTTKSLLDKWKNVIFLLLQRPFEIGPRVTADFGPEWRHLWVDELLQHPSRSIPLLLGDLAQTPAQLLRGPKAESLFASALNTAAAQLLVETYVSYPKGKTPQKAAAQQMLNDPGFKKIAQERVLGLLVQTSAFQSWDKMLDKEYPQGVQQPLSQAAWGTLESCIQMGFADFWAALDTERNINSFLLQEDAPDVRDLWRAFAKNVKLCPFSLKQTALQRPCTVSGEGSMFPFLPHIQRWLGHIRPELVAFLSQRTDATINERFQSAFDWIQKQAVKTFAEVPPPAAPAQPHELKKLLVKHMAAAVAPPGLDGLLVPVAVKKLEGEAEEGWGFVASIVAAVLAAEHVFLSDSASVGCWLVLKRLLDGTSNWSSLCSDEHLPEALVDELFGYGLEGLKTFAMNGEAIRHIDLAHVETAYRTFKSVEKIPLEFLAYKSDLASILVRAKACADLALRIGKHSRSALAKFGTLVMRTQTSRLVGHALLENLESIPGFVQEQWHCKSAIVNQLARDLLVVKNKVADQIKSNSAKCSAFLDLAMLDAFPPKVAVEILEAVFNRGESAEAFVEAVERRLTTTPYHDWPRRPIVLSLFLLLDTELSLPGLFSGKPYLKRLLDIYGVTSTFPPLYQSIGQWLTLDSGASRIRTKVGNEIKGNLENFEKAAERLEEDAALRSKIESLSLEGLERKAAELGTHDDVIFTLKASSNPKAAFIKFIMKQSYGLRKFAVDYLDDNFQAEVVRRQLLVDEGGKRGHLLVPTLLTMNDVDDAKDFFELLPALADTQYLYLKELLLLKPPGWDVIMRRVLAGIEHPTLALCLAAVAAFHQGGELTNKDHATGQKVTELMNGDQQALEGMANWQTTEQDLLKYLQDRDAEHLMPQLQKLKINDLSLLALEQDVTSRIANQASAFKYFRFDPAQLGGVQNVVDVVEIRFSPRLPVQEAAAKAAKEAATNAAKEKAVAEFAKKKADQEKAAAETAAKKAAEKKAASEKAAKEAAAAKDAKGKAAAGAAAKKAAEEAEEAEKSAAEAHVKKKDEEEAAAKAKKKQEKAEAVAEKAAAAAEDAEALYVNTTSQWLDVQKGKLIIEFRNSEKLKADDFIATEFKLTLLMSDSATGNHWFTVPQKSDVTPNHTETRWCPMKEEPILLSAGDLRTLSGHEVARGEKRARERQRQGLYRGLDKVEEQLLDSILNSKANSFLDTQCRATTQRGSATLILQDVEKLIVLCLAATLEMRQRRTHPVSDFLLDSPIFKDKYLWGMSKIKYSDPLSEIDADPVYARQLTMSGYHPIYTCANGHPYWLRDCSRPWVKYKCSFCDSPIGGERHQLLPGNRRVPRPEWTQPHQGYNYSRLANKTPELQPKSFQAFQFWSHALLAGACAFEGGRGRTEDFLPKHYPFSRRPVVEDVMTQCVEALQSLIDMPGAEGRKREDHITELGLMFSDLPGLRGVWNNTSTQDFLDCSTTMVIDTLFDQHAQRPRRPLSKAEAKTHESKDFQVAKIFLLLPPMESLTNVDQFAYDATLDRRASECPIVTLLRSNMGKLMYVGFLPDLLAILRVLYASYNGGRLSKAEAQKMPLVEALGEQRCTEMWMTFRKAWNSMRDLLTRVECAEVRLQEMGEEPPPTLSWFVNLDRGEGMQLWSLVEQVAGYQNTFITGLPEEERVRAVNDAVDVLQFDQRFAVGGGDLSGGSADAPDDRPPDPDQVAPNWMSETLPCATQFSEGKIVYEVEPFEAAAKIAVAPLRYIKLEKPSFQFADVATDWQENLEEKIQQVRLPKGVRHELENLVESEILDQDAISALRLLSTKCVYQLLRGVRADASDRLCDFAEQERLTQYGATFPGELREVRLEHLAEFWTALIEYWDPDFSEMVSWEYKVQFDENLEGDKEVYDLWQKLELWPQRIDSGEDLRTLCVGFKIMLSDKLCEANIAPTSPITYTLAAVAFPEAYDLPRPFPRELPLSKALAAYEYVKLRMKQDEDAPEPVKRMEALLAAEEENKRREAAQAWADQQASERWGCCRPVRDCFVGLWRRRRIERTPRPVAPVAAEAEEDEDYWATRGWS